MQRGQIGLGCGWVGDRGAQEHSEFVSPKYLFVCSLSNSSPSIILLLSLNFSFGQCEIHSLDIFRHLLSEFPSCEIEPKVLSYLTGTLWRSTPPALGQHNLLVKHFLPSSAATCHSLPCPGPSLYILSLSQSRQDAWLYIFHWGVFLCCHNS